MRIKNSHGKVYYGMHFYPGVAEYQQPDGSALRVFLNEDTIRKMDPTFAGCPIYVEHVDEVPNRPGELVDQDADGFVMESFFNTADGKHWVKFLIVSEAGEKAIQSGMRLSNAYVPKSFTGGGLWNGVEYSQEITDGEFEHLAIVRNPRYEESVIMTPEQFKQHNEEKLAELKRLANSKDQKGNNKMSFKLFKRTKVENAIDVEGMSVLLPKSGKEMTIAEIVNSMDDMEEAKKKNEVMADMGHKVKMHDGSMMNVGELMEKHKALQDEMKIMKDGMESGESELETDEPSLDVESSPEMKNDEDEEAKKKEAADADKKKNELEASKKAAKEKADKLRKANSKNVVTEEIQIVQFSSDQVARGKSRYGA